MSVKPSPRPKVSPTASATSCWCLEAEDCADDVLEGVEVDEPADVEGTNVGRKTEGGRVCVGKMDDRELSATSIVIFPMSK